MKNFWILHKILKIQKRKKGKNRGFIYWPKAAIDKRGPDADQYSHVPQDSRAYRSVRNQKPRCKFVAPTLKVECYPLEPKILGHKKVKKVNQKSKNLIKNQATESTPNLFIYFYSFFCGANMPPSLIHRTMTFVKMQTKSERSLVGNSRACEYGMPHKQTKSKMHH